jgi:N-acetylmuramoyl-L-alanine amidase
MKRKLVILDPGHGGLNPNTCKYTTGRKKLYKHEGEWFDGHDGDTFYEGVWNRDIIRRVIRLLKKNDIPYRTTVEESDEVLWNNDFGLMERIYFANHLHRNYDCIYLSCHANAYNGEVTGFETHSHKNSKVSNELADGFYEHLRELFFFDRIKPRSKKHNHRLAVIKYTKMPAVLLEHGFFDVRKEALELNKIPTKTIIAQAWFRVIKDWYEK